MFHYAGVRIVQEERGEGDDDFAIFAHVAVQAAGDRAPREAFEVQIVSPQYLSWLLGEDGDEEIMFGRRLLIIAYFDQEMIEEELRALVEREDLDSWEALRAHIEKYFDWLL